MLLALAATFLALHALPRGQAFALAGVCVALTSVGATIRRPAVDATLAAAIPTPHRDEGFAGSGACRACHPFHFDSWHQSFHRSMTQVASRDSVLGDFDNVTLRSRGRLTRLWKDGDTFWADVVDPLFDLENLNVPLRDLPPEPPRVQARVVMTTGSHHLQTYWLARGDAQVAGARADDASGWLLQLPFVWHVEEGRWIPTQDSFLTPPSRRVAAGTAWNLSCSPCHSVGTRPGLEDSSFDTDTVDLGIACESCHGPGAAHVAANRDPVRRYLQHFDRDSGDPTIVDPRRLDKESSAAICGQCHSFHQDLDLAESREKGVTFRAGDALADHKFVFGFDSDREHPAVQGVLTAEPDAFDGRFWKDGTIRVAGREYNGLVVSKCFEDGEMTCLTCHSLHEYAEPSDQLKPGATGDQTCIDCHGELAQDIRAHTHHAADSPGSSCMNCHMPHTTWGLFTAMRSHRIDSPSAATSARTGRPNACNQCHVDRTLGWTAEQLTAWYGQEPVTDLSKDHQEVAASIVWALRGDAAQRAIAAWTLGWEPARRASGSGWQGSYLSMLLSDPYASVRKAAYDALRKLPGFRDGNFTYDFVPGEAEQRGASGSAMQVWGASRSTFLDRRDAQVLIDDRGEPMQQRIMELYRQRDDTPVRIIE